MLIDVDVTKIVPNPEQPRTYFDEGEMQELANGMAQHKLLNPISLEGPYDDGMFVLIDGERRWRAAKMLDWATIPANVRVQDGQNGQHRLVLALVGNLQRSDMGPVDTARSYEMLRREMSAAEIAAQIGKSVGHVHAYLKLLQLDLHPAVLERLNRRELPYEHTMLKQLAELPLDDQLKLALRAVRVNASIVAIKMMISRYGRAKPLFRRLDSERHTLTNIPALDASDAVLPQTVTQESLLQALRHVCQQCGMEEDDNLSIICRDCPLTLLMKKLCAETKI